MAKKVKAKKAAPTAKKFLALLSHCGSFYQIGEEGQCEGPFATEAEAKERATEMARDYIDDRGCSPGGVWVVEVKDSGQPEGIKWSGKAEEF